MTLADTLAAVQVENASLRAENVARRQQVARLEAQLAPALARLTALEQRPTDPRWSTRSRFRWRWW